MITVVDHVRPWFTPSSRLAATTQCPRRGEDDHERHRQADQPSGHENGLPPEPVGERARREIGDRLGESEGDDERERRDEPGEPEDIGRQERQDGPLLADHPADQPADRDEQGELPEIRLGGQAGSTARRSAPPAQPSRGHGRETPRQEEGVQLALSPDLDLARFQHAGSVPLYSNVR